MGRRRIGTRDNIRVEICRVTQGLERLRAVDDNFRDLHEIARLEDELADLREAYTAAVSKEWDEWKCK